MFLKKISPLLVLGMALTWQPASAQTARVPLLVHIEAYIPSEQFSVSPHGWDNTRALKLDFDSISRRLNPVHHQLKVRSTIGDVSARLEAMAIMTNGTSRIPLNITVGDKTMSGLPQTVAARAEASTLAGSTLGFSIEPGEHAPSLATGNYHGVVSLLFESNPAANPLANP